MTPEEIKQKSDALITELGLSPSVSGVADEKIGMGTYMHILGEYQQMLNDALVLIRELAKNQATQLPKSGTFHD